jgi:hypothetical protein
MPPTAISGLGASDTARCHGDAIGPGAIVFAVMPLTNDPRAKTAVSAWTPPLEAPYAALLDRS